MYTGIIYESNAIAIFKSYDKQIFNTNFIIHNIIKLRKLQAANIYA